MWASPAPEAAPSPAAQPGTPRLRWLGRLNFEPTWRAMQDYTERRDAASPDEIWLLEHDPVYTLGMNADRAHVLAPGDIPVIQIDRGGQVTYHGPGQLLVYPLIDVRRAGLDVRALVTALEASVVEYAARFGIRAQCRADAPGVYVDGAKLASVGLRIRRGGSYHGLALNVDMDLEPFGRINPCGYAGLAMTQLAALGGPRELRQVADEFAPLLCSQLQQRSRARAAVDGARPGPAWQR
ncbi:MAG TPA: lipoyl(octanoyl) transferase LipB [Steroidobacteraceae bacterium]|nr:lipoyl(octanoyl) transferase LipB [Steroidobacteraceae bacterium]